MREPAKKEFHVNGVKITIIKKPALEAVGFTRPANLDGSSIARFIKELEDDGRYAKLAAAAPGQQIWVCLSDGSHSCNKRFCPRCDMSCAGFDVRCTVCVLKEQTAGYDFSQFGEGELFTFAISASEWVLIEQAPEDSQRLDASKVNSEIGYTWNDKHRFHFDNEHEWERDPGISKLYLQPVQKKRNLFKK